MKKPKDKKTITRTTKPPKLSKEGGMRFQERVVETPERARDARRGMPEKGCQKHKQDNWWRC
jgi:hypothetical protein